VLTAVRAGTLAGREELFACVLDSSGRVQGAALRTPPRPMLCTPLEPDAAEELIASWVTEDPGLDAVNSVGDRPGAGRGVGCPGRRPDRNPDADGDARAPVGDRSAASRSRPPVSPERGWMRAARSSGSTRDARSRWWPSTRRVAGVARVGPVYTPPPDRGRGYAGSAVAALSRRALAEGADRCALFTDLANPTSNKIYAQVGYRRLCDWETILLGPAQETLKRRLSRTMKSSHVRAARSDRLR
jgi:hypothetical protein